MTANGLSMLEELSGTVQDIVKELFVRNSPTETWVFSAVLIFTVVVVYELVAKAFGLKSRLVFVLVPGVLLMLLAVAAMRVFWTEQRMFQWGAALLMFFIVVLPLTGYFHGSSWISSLILWGVTLLTAVTMFYAEQITSEAVHKGAGSGSRMQQRQQQTDQLFKGK
jgi:hypothetical protein